MMQHVESYNNLLLSKPDQNKEKTVMPITISVELERPKPELLDLLPYADVAFIAKDFANSRDLDNMSDTLRNISEEAKTGATLICAWGDRGAMARTPDGVIVQSPAFPPPKIVDSLGAGDTFNAAILYYLNKSKFNFVKGSLNDIRNSSKDDGLPEEMVKRDIKQNYNIESSEYSRTEFIDQKVLQAAVTFACRVAGSKVGMKGYDGLDKLYRNT